MQMTRIDGRSSSTLTIIDIVLTIVPENKKARKVDEIVFDITPVNHISVTQIKRGLVKATNDRISSILLKRDCALHKISNGWTLPESKRLIFM